MPLAATSNWRWNGAAGVLHLGLALDPRPTECAIDDHRDGTVGTQGAQRSTRAQKQRIGLRRRPTCLHVRCDRLAHLLSQGQSGLTAALTADMNPCTLPVDVLQTHLHDVTCRRPRRASRRSMARSRLPADEDGLQEAMRRSTSSGGRYRGRELRRQCGTTGMAPARPARQWPSAIRNRRNMRSAVLHRCATHRPP